MSIIFRYRVDVLDALRKAGYNSTRIRHEGLINQTALQKLRRGKMISWAQLGRVCNLLDCELSDLIERVPGEQDDGEQ